MSRSTTARSSTTPRTTIPSSACAPPRASAADLRVGIDSLGVVVGGSGNGEQMAANKVIGIRAALVWSTETAALAREHNDANVISVGGRMHSLDDMTSFVGTFLDTAFSGDERHVRRIGQLSSYETTRVLPHAARLRPPGRTAASDA